MAKYKALTGSAVKGLKQFVKYVHGQTNRQLKNIMLSGCFNGWHMHKNMNEGWTSTAICRNTETVCVHHKLSRASAWLWQVKMCTCNILLLATFWRSWWILSRIFKNIQEDRLKLFKCHHRHREVTFQSFNLVSEFLWQTGHISPLLHFLEKLY